jgi:hypothetical protein
MQSLRGREPKVFALAGNKIQRVMSRGEKKAILGHSKYAYGMKWNIIGYGVISCYF